MPIRTIDVDKMAERVGSIYESTVILGKRARQISTKMKQELDEKLSYYGEFESELEDPRFQDEQTKVSLEHEVKPKPTELAIQEMFNDEIYYRNPEPEESELL